MDHVYIIIKNTTPGAILEEYGDVTTLFLATCAVIANQIDKKYKIEIYGGSGPSGYTSDLLRMLLKKFQNLIIPKICEHLKFYPELELETDCLKIESMHKSYYESTSMALFRLLSVASELDQINAKLKKSLNKNLLNIVKNYIIPDQDSSIEIPDPKDCTRSHTIKLEERGYTFEKEITILKLKKIFETSKYLNYLLKYIKYNNLSDGDVVFITKSCPID